MTEIKFATLTRPEHLGEAAHYTSDGTSFDDSGEPWARWDIVHTRCCCQRGTFRIFVMSHALNPGAAYLQMEVIEQHGSTRWTHLVDMSGGWRADRFQSMVLENVRAPNSIEIKRLTADPADTLVGEIVVTFIPITEAEDV